MNNKLNKLSVAMATAAMDSRGAADGTWSTRGSKDIRPVIDAGIPEFPNALSLHLIRFFRIRFYPRSISFRFWQSDLSSPLNYLTMITLTMIWMIVIINWINLISIVII